MSELNRREFVQLSSAAAVAMAAAGCLCCEEVALAEGPASAPSQGDLPAKFLDVGTVDDYPKDGISDKFAAKPTRVLVVRKGDRIYASSATCTHRACGVKVKMDTHQLACPCHGSKFDNNGKPVSGPAKAPLFRHAITLNEQKHLIVDKSKQFGEKEWDNAQAFVKVS